MTAPEVAADPFDDGRDEAYLAAVAEDIPLDDDDAGPEMETVPSAMSRRNPSAVLPEDCSWSAFLRFCKQRQDLSAAFSGMLRTASGEWQDGSLAVTPASEFGAERLRSAETWSLLSSLVAEYYGDTAGITVLPPPRMKTATEIKEAVRQHPAVSLLEKEMGARLIDYGQQG